jgi:probable aminopeptidase NPEPL1
MIQAGQACGDLAHPLLYCPEELMAEFHSPVADMKNSVKDRMNAQASCAGHFIGSHLPENWSPRAGG